MLSENSCPTFASVTAIFKSFILIREYCLDNDLCSRVSATRDPGSVSEAESEEENEEGDYTVYECPGLASVSYIYT